MALDDIVELNKGNKNSNNSSILLKNHFKVISAYILVVFQK